MKWTVSVVAICLTLLAAAGWFLVDMGSDLAKAQALAEERKHSIDRLEASRERIEAQFAALARSNSNSANTLRIAERDIEALRAIPSDGRCGAPVHAAVDLLRDDAR